MSETSGFEKIIREFRITVGFLTVFRTPVAPAPDMIEIGRSSWAFPVVGTMIGLILGLSYWFCSILFPPTILSLLVVTLWVVLTGGLHLDGWTDCWDAFGASVPTERRREILKDSRLGAFGAIALILLILAKILTIMSIKSPVLGIFIAPVVGRSMMILASQEAKTPDIGIGSGFLQGVDRRACVFCWIFSIITGLFAGLTGLLAVAAAYGAATWFRTFSESKVGFVNGDVLGSMCELTEVTVLLALCLK
ncbi:MAG: adenosylcobinamide-GDP ribazoletransferase [Desulfomonilaceae bacterium]